MRRMRTAEDHLRFLWGSWVCCGHTGGWIKTSCLGVIFCTEYKIYIKKCRCSGRVLFFTPVVRSSLLTSSDLTVTTPTHLQWRISPAPLLAYWWILRSLSCERSVQSYSKGNGAEVKTRYSCFSSNTGPCGRERETLKHHRLSAFTK